MVIQESVYSRHGADRLLKYAFELAQSRPRKHVTLATKSNGIAINMPWWDSRADAVGSDYPEVTLNKQHIDILSAHFVRQPGRFDVVAATNLFGDILSSGAQISLAVRAGAWFGPRYLRQEHCQPGGHGLVGRVDAGLPGQGSRRVPTGP